MIHLPKAGEMDAIQSVIRILKRIIIVKHIVDNWINRKAPGVLGASLSPCRRHRFLSGNFVATAFAGGLGVEVEADRCAHPFIIFVFESHGHNHREFLLCPSGRKVQGR